MIYPSRATGPDCWASFLEELIGGLTGSLLAKLVGFEPGDLALQQRDVRVDSHPGETHFQVRLPIPQGA